MGLRPTYAATSLQTASFSDLGAINRVTTTRIEVVAHRRSLSNFQGDAIEPVYSIENLLGFVLGGTLVRAADSAAISALAAEGVIDSGAASSLQGFRLSQQLAAEEAAGASAPTSITSYSAHALDQIAGRDAGIGVSQSALEDAFANPNAIQYAPSAYGPTFRFVGNDATVVVNAQGNVVTGWATSRAGVGP